MMDRAAHRRSWGWDAHRGQSSRVDMATLAGARCISVRYSSTMEALVLRGGVGVVHVGLDAVGLVGGVDGARHVFGAFVVPPEVGDDGALEGVFAGHGPSTLDLGGDGARAGSTCPSGAAPATVP